MSQMPRQEYECPRCGERRKTIILRPLCEDEDCGYCDLVPVMHQPSKRDMPAVGCLLLIASGAVSLFVIQQIIGAIFP